MATLHGDPELFEPVSRDDLYDMQAEIADLNARIEALVEAVRVLGRDQYKPLPVGSLSDAIARADRH